MRGILRLMLFAGPPASISNTVCRPPSVNRFASTQPAEPAPITTKSNSAFSGTEVAYIGGSLAVLQTPCDTDEKLFPEYRIIPQRGQIARRCLWRLARPSSTSAARARTAQLHHSISGRGQPMEHPGWLWPHGKRIAVVFNVCLEAWSDGKAPGISPMGNPLPAGALDHMAISWAAYGTNRGIYRLLDSLARFDVKASVMINAIIAERSPAAIKAVADGGHEVLSHSYAMDVIPALLSQQEERQNIKRCTSLLERASGNRVLGWLSPRGTSSGRTPLLLADAGY